MNGIRPERAGLRGVRLVTANEIEEGHRWAASKIKMLTGGDPVAARFMRQDYFEYTPQCKIVIAGNRKPSLAYVDEAMRRRIQLIPFTVTIPAAERDKNLSERLEAEWPGILNWIIEGCLEWQQQGLSPPGVISDATAAYLDAEDDFSAWLEECCVRDPNGWERTGDLFASWSKWAREQGEECGNNKRLKANLACRGFAHKRESGTGRSGHKGLRLKRCEGT